MRAAFFASIMVAVAIMQAVWVPGVATSVGTGDLELYHSYDSMTEELKALAEEHGDILSLISIGRTFEGRDIWAAKLSDTPWEDEDEPEVLITGAHHAKEWPSVEVAMATLRLLVDSYGRTAADRDGDGFADSDNDQDGQVEEDPFDAQDNDGDGAVDEDWEDARLSWLVDNRQVWVVPMLNPDGLEFCRGQVASGVTDEGSLWRKNREPNYQEWGRLEGATYGVDLNRNYGFHWGELGAQSYADSRAEDYIGPVDKRDDDGDRRVNEDPMDNVDNDRDGLVDEDGRGGFTATEIGLLRDLIEAHEFAIALNFHTFKGTIYWPWMWTLDLPEDEPTFAAVAGRMAEFNGYEWRNMSDRNQQWFSRHPPVDGDSNDWMYGKYGILAYTIELGTNVFIPGEEELAAIIAENLGANLLAVEVADNPRMDRVVLEHEPLNDTVSEGPYEVSVRMAGGELVAGGMTLHHRVAGGEFEVSAMEAGNGAGEYLASIPGAGPGKRVEYFFVAVSAAQGTTFLPAYGPYQVFSFNVLGTGPSHGGTVVSAVAILLVLALGTAYTYRRRLGPAMRRLGRRTASVHDGEA